MHFCACSDSRQEPASLAEEGKKSVGTSTSLDASKANKHCDVHVWGSNSSHQLAEVSPEKIFIPKLAKAFIDVQQVNTCTKYLV
jgi:hypothetical protein